MIYTNFSLKRGSGIQRNEKYDLVYYEKVVGVIPSDYSGVCMHAQMCEHAQGCTHAHTHNISKFLFQTQHMIVTTCTNVQANDELF
jgi:hypothetical protein